MSTRRMLQFMCPLGFFDHWSEEEVRQQVVMMLVTGRWPAESPYSRN